MVSTVGPEGSYVSRDSATPQGVSTATPRVLIIEDDRDCHEGWSIWLRHSGFEVLSAFDGASGLQAIETEDPHLVLLDLGLPRMHGFKVLHEMRMQKLNQPVLVLSATSSPTTDERATNLGATAVLAKPVPPRELTTAINDLLGRTSE